MSLIIALMMLPGLVIGLTLHEFAHAWSASLLGDDFARRQGRVSLNPFRHLSLLGTIVLFVLGFGWGKPVPVNLYNFRRPKRDYLITSLAGPAANLAVAALCLLAMLLTRRTYALGRTAGAFVDFAHYMLELVAVINVILAAINLLPVPPLDGSKIWPCIIPGMKPSFRMKTTMVFGVLLLMLMWSGGLSSVMNPVVDGVMAIAPEPDSQKARHLLAEGQAAIDAEDWPLAESRLADSLRYNPYSGPAHYERAYALWGMNRMAEAVGEAKRAIGVDPQNPDYVDRLSQLYGNMGRRQDADEARQRAARLRGEPPASPAPQPATSPSSPS